MRYKVFLISLLIILTCGFAGTVMWKHTGDFPVIVNLLSFATLGVICGVAMIAGYYSGSAIIYHWRHE